MPTIVTSAPTDSVAAIVVDKRTFVQKVSDQVRTAVMRTSFRYAVIGGLGAIVELWRQATPEQQAGIVGAIFGDHSNAKAAAIFLMGYVGLAFMPGSKLGPLTVRFVQQLALQGANAALAARGMPLLPAPDDAVTVQHVETKPAAPKQEQQPVTIEPVVVSAPPPAPTPAPDDFQETQHVDLPLAEPSTALSSEALVAFQLANLKAGIWPALQQSFPGLDEDQIRAVVAAPAPQPSATVRSIPNPKES